MTIQSIIGIMGPGNNALAAERELAYALGKAVAQQGWILLTGGRPAGVMEAASQGAASVGGTVLGILPDDKGIDIAHGVTLPIVTGMGHARNAINVLSSHGIIACGLGLGTVSEIALALKAQKPVVLMPYSSLTQEFFEYLAPGQFYMTDDVKLCIKHLQSALHPS
ncbi:p450 cytochrome [Leptolyngbya sp. Heron Island J]|uniref:TIGR00725 family protein n=1 Tax=Leptolyngbya sp. Heron Island J TaxID=1385935 RepID=UPI0003B98C8A|nr:TIGR00725 family protein [Leptolyngbya sp. Heron Island J]ESA39023.1 p450 cytochrome [Leptolyngbya sp. Heron Island J]